ncbi:MAG: hypothetical protein ACRCXZ_10290 [Patescibacteria group bacterium]
MDLIKSSSLETDRKIQVFIEDCKSLYSLVNQLKELSVEIQKRYMKGEIIYQTFVSFTTKFHIFFKSIEDITSFMKKFHSELNENFIGWFEDQEFSELLFLQYANTHFTKRSDEMEEKYDKLTTSFIPSIQTMISGSKKLQLPGVRSIGSPILAILNGNDTPTKKMMIDFSNMVDKLRTVAKKFVHDLCKISESLRNIVDLEISYFRLVVGNDLVDKVISMSYNYTTNELTLPKEEEQITFEPEPELDSDQEPDIEQEKVIFEPEPEPEMNSDEEPDIDSDKESIQEKYPVQIPVQKSYGLREQVNNINPFDEEQKTENNQNNNHNNNQRNDYDYVYDSEIFCEKFKKEIIKLVDDRLIPKTMDELELCIMSICQ